MRVYLSGGMSGIKDLNGPAFRLAARSLRANGHEVVSPIELDEAGGTLVEVPVGSKAWQGFLKRDLAAMMACDAIHALDGWENSRGASLEVYVGRELGLLRCDADGTLVSWGESVLMEAERLINGPRQKDYGHPAEDFQRTGRIWGAILGIPDVPPERVGLCLVGVKISREVNAPKRDNRVDGPGYFGCVDLIEQRKANAVHLTT